MLKLKIKLSFINQERILNKAKKKNERVLKDKLRQFKFEKEKLQQVQNEKEKLTVLNKLHKSQKILENEYEEKEKNINLQLKLLANNLSNCSDNINKTLAIQNINNKQNQLIQLNNKDKVINYDYLSLKNFKDLEQNVHLYNFTNEDLNKAKYSVEHSKITNDDFWEKMNNINNEIEDVQKRFNLLQNHNIDQY